MAEWVSGWVKGGGRDHQFSQREKARLLTLPSPRAKGRPRMGWVVCEVAAGYGGSNHFSYHATLLNTLRCGCHGRRYDIKCKMIDQAVSMDNNAGFTHWRSRIVNKVRGLLLVGWHTPNMGQGCSGVCCVSWGVGLEELPAPRVGSISPAATCGNTCQVWVAHASALGQPIPVASARQGVIPLLTAAAVAAARLLSAAARGCVYVMACHVRLRV